MGSIEIICGGTNSMRYNVRWNDSETKKIYKAILDSELLIEYLEENLFKENLIVMSGEQPTPHRGYGVMIYYSNKNPLRQLLTAAPRRRNNYIHVVIVSGILSKSELLENKIDVGNYPDNKPDVKLKSKAEVDKLIELIKVKNYKLV